MRFPSIEPYIHSVRITPKSPKWWLKTRIFTFGVAIHISVAGNLRHFKFDMWVEHSNTTTSIFTFYVALCIFVTGDRKDFKFDVLVERASRSLRTTNRP